VRDQIEHALKGHNADYVEIRVEEASGASITYRSQEIDNISNNRSFGGCARALVNGGWGFVSFNSADGLRDKLSQAVEQARLVGSEDSKLAEVEPHVEVVAPALLKDPASVPLPAKKELLDEYVDLVWRQPGVTSSTVTYVDGSRTSYFGNSDGSYIEQSRVDVRVRVEANAKRDGDVQQAGFSMGGLGDYGWVERLHDDVREAAKLAVDFLDAPTVAGGPYAVVLDPVLAGVFVHEAFGHLSESDFVAENDRMKDIMVLGKRFGGEHINITDGAARPGLRGSYKYDDEGTPSALTPLVREGVLVGRLHSRETAARMGEQPTGNARAISYAFPPIVRMTNTYIEPGDVTFEEMLAGVDEGLYVKSWYGGMTSMEMFTFSAGEAYRIRNGRIEELVRPVVLTGNLFETLQNLDAIGNDLGMNQGGGCGKGGQSPLPVSTGSPHIRIRNCLIAGA
jgi:TldD protein